MKKLSCLLIGANGNVGSAIRRTEAFETTCVTRQNWSELRNDQAKDFDLIIHAAGGITLNPAKDPLTYVDSNIRVLTEVLDWLGPRRKPRIFFISSAAVYGNSISTVESSLPAPVSINGVAKLFGEMILKSFCKERGIDFVCCRVFNIFGGDDKFSVLHHLGKAALSGAPFVMNNQGRAYRDFIHVDDVAAVLLSLTFVDNLPKYMNIGTGVATRISDVVDSFTRYVPSLKTEIRNCFEAEYSRADTALLNKYYSKPFTSLLDQIPDFANDINSKIFINKNL